MKTVTETLRNGKLIEYKCLDNGHCYHSETNDRVIDVIERAWYRGERIKIYLGDIKTGKDWNEEHDTIGRIGFSTGNIKIPLLLVNSSSYGGGAILDHCIIKIKEAKTGLVLYQAANYNTAAIDITKSDMPEYSHNITINGKIYSRHKTERSAKLLLSKLK